MPKNFARLPYNFKKNFYCISSRMENSGQFYGCFKIGPFYGHQSLTFANLLRRTLLSDKSRCIFEAIQIQGVEHEFSSLVGVRESIIDIILNLEKIVFQTKQPITKPQTAIIDFYGPGILRAQHIHLPANIKCLGPSQYIATVEIDGHLRIQLFFSPNWDKFQPFIQRNIFKNKEFQKNKYLGFQNNVFKLNKKFSFLLRQVNLMNFKYFTFLRYLPLMKRHLPPVTFYKNNKINFREIAATAFIKQKNHLQSKKKNQKLKTNLFKNIQENWLFIQTSPCAITKVHYTIQSNGKERNNTWRFNTIKEKTKDLSSRTRRSSELVKASKTQLKYQLNFKKIDNKLVQKLAETEKNIYNVNERQNDLMPSQGNLFNSPLNKQILRANNEEFILFEIWTDGSIHPQKAIGKAINEILLELFPYSLYIKKINLLSVKNTSNQSLKCINKIPSKVLESHIKRKNITEISKKNFSEKLLNLDIGNFHFDLETYTYLKEKKIYRIVDFLNFLKQNSTEFIELKKSKKLLNFPVVTHMHNGWQKNTDNFSQFLDSKSNLLNTTTQIKNTLLNFQIFILSFLK